MGSADRFPCVVFLGFVGHGRWQGAQRPTHGRQDATRSRAKLAQSCTSGRDRLDNFYASPKKTGQPV